MKRTKKTEPGLLRQVIGVCKECGAKIYHVRNRNPQRKFCTTSCRGKELQESAHRKRKINGMIKMLKDFL